MISEGLESKWNSERFSAAYIALGLGVSLSREYPLMSIKLDRTDVVIPKQVNDCKDLQAKIERHKLLFSRLIEKLTAHDFKSQVAISRWHYPGCCLTPSKTSTFFEKKCSTLSPRPAEDDKACLCAKVDFLYERIINNCYPQVIQRAPQETQKAHLHVADALEWHMKNYFTSAVLPCDLSAGGNTSLTLSAGEQKISGSPRESQAGKRRAYYAQQLRKSAGSLVKPIISPRSSRAIPERVDLSAQREILQLQLSQLSNESLFLCMLFWSQVYRTASSEEEMKLAEKEVREMSTFQLMLSKINFVETDLLEKFFRTPMLRCLIEEEMKRFVTQPLLPDISSKKEAREFSNTKKVSKSVVAKENKLMESSKLCTGLRLFTLAEDIDRLLEFVKLKKTDGDMLQFDFQEKGDIHEAKIKYLKALVDCFLVFDSQKAAAKIGDVIRGKSSSSFSMQGSDSSLIEAKNSSESLCEITSVEVPEVSAMQLENVSYKTIDRCWRRSFNPHENHRSKRSRKTTFSIQCNTFLNSLFQHASKRDSNSLENRLLCFLRMFTQELYTLPGLRLQMVLPEGAIIDTHQRWIHFYFHADGAMCVEALAKFIPRTGTGDQLEDFVLLTRNVMTSSLNQLPNWVSKVEISTEGNLEMMPPFIREQLEKLGFSLNT